MKKLLLFVLALTVLCLPLTGLAVTYTSEQLGLSFELPEGFTTEEGRDDDAGYVALTITSSDGSVVYAFGVVFSDEFDGIDLAKITEEEIGKLIAIALDGLEFKVIVNKETPDEPFIEFMSMDDTKYVVIDYIDEGYAYLTCLVSLSGEALTEAQFNAFYDFLETVTFAEE